jgi:hypothetical protein
MITREEWKGQVGKRADHGKRPRRGSRAKQRSNGPLNGMHVPVNIRGRSDQVRISLITAFSLYFLIFTTS